MENGMEKINPKIETIIASAIKLGKEIFTGNTHIDAIIAMEEAYPDWSDSGMPIEDGFMTNTGRFVLRHEAGEIANKAAQLNHLDPRKKRDAMDFLDSHDIAGLKPKWLK